KQTGYSFFFDVALLEKAGKVTIEVKNVPLETALDIALKDQGLTYKVIEKTIVLKPKVKSNGADDMTDAAAPPVTGVIRGANDEPLAKVTIRVKGKKTTVTSDDNGNFTIDARQGDVLIFSSVGYETQEVKIKSIAAVNIAMKRSVTSLNEMVVMGYGSTRRRDLTGSVSSVNPEEIKNTPFVSIDQALAGKAAGVQVVQADGSPGGVARIRIRGGTSLIGGNDPLYIIDGVQVQIANQYIGAGAEITNPIEGIGGSSRDASRGSTVGSSFARGLNTLAGLNINDIESIDILKDASATAIYGSRAANGVVIITTKKGRRNEKPVLEANYYYGVSRPVTEKVLNASQYRDIYLKGSRNLNERLAAKGLPADPAATAYIANPALLGTADINWIDLVTRTGGAHNADVSVRGGGSGSSYFMSLGYNASDGTLLGTSFSRVAGKFNLNNEFNNKLRLITNLDYGFTKNNITNGLYGAALLAPPTWGPYNADGTLSAFPNAIFPGSTSTASGIVNPMALLSGKNQADGLMLLGSIALEYDVLKDLKFRSVASINYSTSHQVTYEPSTVPVINNSLGAVAGSTGVGSQSQLQNKNVFFENTLTWDKTFNANHRITLLGGTSWQKTSSTQFSASGQTYPDNTYLNGLSSAAVYLRPTAAESYASLLSFYTRANYAFKERYLLTLTGRADASSKFPPKNRVGYFPSFGVAWRMKEESFLKNVTWLSELKLRASAGYTGTQNIGDNMFYTLYTPAAYAGTNALVPTQLGNDEIKWENTLQKDAGIDVSLFNGRITSSIGYYEKYTKGLLMAASVPLSTGFATAIVNKVDIRNRGVEIEVRGEIIKGKSFGWTMGLNVSGNRSRVEKLNRLLPNATSLGYDDPVYTGESIGNYALVPGQPIGQMYGAVFLGLLKTQQQVNDYLYGPTNPNGSIWATFPPTSNTIGIGSPRYQTYGDVYGTKALAPYLFNRTQIGGATPKFFGGITNTFSYKNFSLIANLTYSYGGNILYLYESNTYGLADLRNRGVRTLLPTVQDDPGSSRPTIYLKEANTATGAGASTLNVFDASYIKLKSINISYALPQAWLKKVGLKQGLVYMAGSNLFRITSYPGPDPEVSNDPYSIIGGNTDDGSYPQARQYTFGVRFGF
ncbi:MAG: TonB-dependent receptor, partial [Bacteroidetes bacterium]|nr:TonB-dependent receptor [Bacteroidota bacterium]